MTRLSGFASGLMAAIVATVACSSGEGVTGAMDAGADAMAVACPKFQGQPTCPAAPGAVDCARPEIGCGLDALPSGLSCSAPGQCSALIYPCPGWQRYIGGERVDGYICSCTEGHWSCDDCSQGTALCMEAPDGAPLNLPPVLDAAADGETEGGVSGGPCVTSSDCDAGEQCLYRVGDCSAQGQCLSIASLGAQCHHEVAYCACNGTTVAGLCGPPYAYGPTPSADAASPCGHADAGDASTE